MLRQEYIAFDAPVRRVPVGISPSSLVRKKQNGVAARRLKNFEDIFIRFETTYERDRHTHRQTPHDGIGRAHASHRAAKTSRDPVLSHGPMAACWSM